MVISTFSRILSAVEDSTRLAVAVAKSSVKVRVITKVEVIESQILRP